MYYVISFAVPVQKCLMNPKDFCSSYISTFHRVTLIPLHSSLANNEAVSGLEPRYSLVDHLINNNLCGLLFIHNSSGFTHEEWAGVVQSIIIKLITKAFKVMLDRDFTTTC
jgi:hypothetical protein